MKLLLYCTKDKKQLVKWEKYMYGENGKNDKFNSLNGKIVAECDFEIEKIIKKHYEYFKYCYITESLNEWKLMYKSLLDGVMMDNYLQGNNGYAIHIKNLHIFDEPKELNEFYYRTIEKREFEDMPYDELIYKTVTKAPQNMMYVYDELQEHEYILISIRPKWLCKILNNEKTIEVRKKVLNKMLK